MNQKEIKRQKKLNLLQERHRALTRKKKSIKNRMTKDIDEISLINKAISELGGQIFDLKNIDNEIPHITDHAVVRYLERVKGINIWDIKAEIAQHHDAVRVDNVIVTINGGDKDNLSKIELVKTI